MSALRVAIIERELGTISVAPKQCSALREISRGPGSLGSASICQMADALVVMIAFGVKLTRSRSTRPLPIRKADTCKRKSRACWQSPAASPTASSHARTSRRPEVAGYCRTPGALPEFARVQGRLLSAQLREMGLRLIKKAARGRSTERLRASSARHPTYAHIALHS